MHLKKAAFFFILVLISVFAKADFRPYIFHEFLEVFEKDSTADAQKVVADYIAAIGGTDALKKVNSIYTKDSISVQGMNLHMIHKQLAPNLDLTQVEMNGNVMTKTVFDGNSAYMEQMGQKINFGDNDIKDKKSLTSLFPQLQYQDSGFRVVFNGTVTEDSITANKITITTPSGKIVTEYYDPQTKLLVRQDASATIQNTTINNSTIFSNYKKVDNILIPYKLHTTVSGMGQKQSIDAYVTDASVNKDVTAEDFK